MDRLRALRYFLKVAETSSFTTAAQVFSVPGSSISRRIRDLEVELGVELFHRSTRVVHLTELGRLYHDRVQPALAALDHADRMVGQQSQSPTGTLRITAAPSFGNLRLLPALEKFRAAYPEIVVDVELTDHRADFASGNIDIAIRAASELPDRAVARKLSDNNFVLVAAPDYLARYGTPTQLSQLRQHKAILYRGPNGLLTWQARQDSVWQTVETSPVFISNNGGAILSATLTGEGIALLPEWGVAVQIERGDLRKLTFEGVHMAVTRGEDPGIFLLYFRPKYELLKVRVAVDFLLSEFA